MRTEQVSFFSEGTRLAGFLRWPDDEAGQPLPVILHCPGWMGLAESAVYEKWHRAFTASGFAVLVFDYRGFGKSGGTRGWVRPDWQVEDALAAATYATTVPRLDSGRMGAFGTGGTGGAVAITAAASDEAIRCLVVQYPIADGAQWLRDMRREYEWAEFCAQLAEDRRSWVLNGEGSRVDPLRQLMVATPERASAALKTDVDPLLEPTYYLRSGDYLRRLRPIDVVHRIAPRPILITCVIGDAVTPQEHAEALFRKAQPPKRLIRQFGTSHYAAENEDFEFLSGQFTSWFREHLSSHPVRFLAEQDEVVEVRRTLQTPAPD